MSMYLLNEKLTSTIAVYMILKRVMKDWKDWPAYKHGIIDDKGKRLRRPKTSKEREGWDILDRFCWSIKRVCTKYLGDSKFAYLFSLVYLMKEKQEYTITTNIEKYRVELDDFTAEKQYILYECFRKIEQSGLIHESLDVQSNIYKILTVIPSTIINMFEDVSVSDVAMFTPKINISKLKRYKKKKYKRGTIYV